MEELSLKLCSCSWMLFDIDSYFDFIFFMYTWLAVFANVTEGIQILFFSVSNRVFSWGSRRRLYNWKWKVYFFTFWTVQIIWRLNFIIDVFMGPYRYRLNFSCTPVTQTGSEFVIILPTKPKSLKNSLWNTVHKVINCVQNLKFKI